MIQKIYSKKFGVIAACKAFILVFSFILLHAAGLYAQISPGVYVAEEQTPDGLHKHEIKATPSYLVYTEYQEAPPEFIKTFGGKYTIEDSRVRLEMEFNSEFGEEAAKSLELPVEIEKGKLLWGDQGLEFTALDSADQPLDGLWLFATRGPDTGQERRGEANTRKTLKILLDGRFQWIAYDTADMGFFGTGGGKYEAANGSYVEHIEYFSRDNSRVGATLEFSYELEGTDWHHKGLNSRGEPMYEIWARREVSVMD